MKKNLLVTPSPTIIIPRKAAGDFSASVLLEINLKASEMWADGAQRRMEANTVAAQAVKENQTARFEILKDPKKDREVKVTWLKTCGAVDEACDTNCDIQEDEIESDGQEYGFDICRKVGFSIDEEKFRTNNYSPEEAASEALADRLSILDEFWNRQILLKLSDFAGANAYPAPWTYAAGTTTIPSAEYNLKMVAALVKQAKQNKLKNAYYIEDGTLWIPKYNAGIDGANGEGKGDAQRAAILNMYHDLTGFGESGLTENLFAIDKSAIAFETKNRHTAIPRVINSKVGQTLYTVASPTIPGVVYDVYYVITCKTVGNETHYVHTWRIETRGGIWLNPESCPITVGGSEVTRTGVLSYTIGA